MTEREAREIIISRMNYMAYSEYGCSLYASDKNRLYGAEHYQLEPNSVPNEESSAWAPGGRLEPMLPDLVLAAWISAPSEEKRTFEIAMSVVQLNRDSLGGIVRRAAKDPRFRKKWRQILLGLFC